MTGIKLRIGVLRLVDSAPALVARDLGFFADNGLEALIQIEPSWANIVDKLTWGVLDAAILLPPLALAAAMGLRGKKARLLVPMGLTQGGNSIVLGRGAAAVAQPAETGQAVARAAGAELVQWLRGQKAPPRFGVVHKYSAHNLLLRSWLADSGGDPDRLIETVVVPPEQAVDALADGSVAGFCAGAPWGEVAARRGAGRVFLGTSSIWPSHPEKCLAVSQDWMERSPGAMTGLLRAMLAAARICDRPERSATVAASLLALDLPLAASIAALPGGSGLERIQFWRGEPYWPRQEHALWMLTQMRRWGWIDTDLDLIGVAEAVYRGEWIRGALG